MRRVMFLFCVAFLVCLSACTMENTVTNGDRELSNQNSQAAVELSKVAAMIATGDAASAVVVIVGIASDIKANADQQITNWGGPAKLKDPQPYTPANSAKARDDSKNEHSKPWYVVLFGNVYTAVLTAAGFTVAAIKIASNIPAVGQFFGGPLGSALADIAGRFVGLKQKADANPTDTLHLSDIHSEIVDMSTDPVLKPILEKAHLTALTNASTSLVGAPLAPNTVGVPVAANPVNSPTG